mmetsp:Transcript_12225/g.36850  ORF Transcript_12225/g.36850 Transcript_12225/m.36850 type:complete len:84 (+) Transcript_12225:1417-1668(+)
MKADHCLSVMPHISGGTFMLPGPVIGSHLGRGGHPSADSALLAMLLAMCSRSRGLLVDCGHIVTQWVSCRQQLQPSVPCFDST